MITLAKGSTYENYQRNTRFWQRALLSIVKTHYKGAKTPENAWKFKAASSGDNPVFFASNSGTEVVIKFVSPWHGGVPGWQREICCLEHINRVMKTTGGEDTLNIPQMLFNGELYDQEKCDEVAYTLNVPVYSWPYIILSMVEGTSIDWDERDTSITLDEAAIELLAKNLKAIHQSTPISKDAPTYDAFKRFIMRQKRNCIKNHKEWDDLNTHCFDKLSEYLPANPDILINQDPQAFIHTDLNDENILCKIVDATIVPTSLIDFAEAGYGDPMYDFVALFLSVFRCDKDKMTKFLKAYGYEWNESKRKKIMMYTLLNKQDALRTAFKYFPDYAKIKDLDELAAALYP